MNTVDRLTDAMERAANSLTASERAWWADHATYILTACANRPIYRALIADAASVGVSASTFNADVRLELDADKADLDAGEWVRAGRWVLECYSVEDYDGPSAAHEDAMRRREAWRQACDSQLDREAAW